MLSICLHLFPEFSSINEVAVMSNCDLANLALAKDRLSIPYFARARGAISGVATCNMAGKIV